MSWKKELITAMATRLSSERKRLGYGKQIDLARKLGLSQAVYSRFENGTRAIPEKVFSVFADAGINVEFVKYGNKNINSANVSDSAPTTNVNEMARQLLVAQTEAKLYKELCDKHFDRLKNVLTRCEQRLK